METLAINHECNRCLSGRSHSCTPGNPDTETYSSIHPRLPTGAVLHQDFATVPVPGCTTLTRHPDQDTTTDAFTRTMRMAKSGARIMTPHSKLAVARNISVRFDYRLCTW